MITRRDDETSIPPKSPTIIPAVMTQLRIYIAVFAVLQSTLTTASAVDLAAEPPEPTEAIALRLPVDERMVILSRSDLEAIALQRHPGLDEARARIEAALGRSWQAGLPPNPTLGYSSSEVGNDGHAGQQGIYVGQQFIRGGKRELDRAAACREVSRLREQYRAMQLRVLTDVRASFYEIRWLQRRVELFERFRDTNGQAANLASQLFQVGDKAKSDVLLAEIELQQTISDLASVETQLESKWRELARLVGDPQLAQSWLSDEGIPAAPEINWDEALALIAQSPLLAAGAAEVSQAQVLLRRAIAEPIPDLDTQVVVQYDNGSQYTIAGVQAVMPIPLRNRNQGGIFEARANIRAAQQRLNRLRLELERDLAAKFGEYRNARIQANLMKSTVVPKAEEVVRIAFEAYQAGEISMSDVLNAQRSLLRATLRQQDAEKDVQSAYVAIEGFLLSDSLGVEDP